MANRHIKRKLHILLLALLVLAALSLACGRWDGADGPTYGYAGSVSSPTGESLAWDLSVEPQSLDFYDADGMCVRTVRGHISLADLERAIARFEEGVR